MLIHKFPKTKALFKKKLLITMLPVLNLSLTLWSRTAPPTGPRVYVGFATSSVDTAMITNDIRSLKAKAIFQVSLSVVPATPTIPNPAHLLNTPPPLPPHFPPHSLATPLSLFCRFTLRHHTIDYEGPSEADRQ